MPSMNNQSKYNEKAQSDIKFGVLIFVVNIALSLYSKVPNSMINRNTSPSARLQVLEPATVYRSLSPEPPVYYQHKEQVKEQNGQYRQQPSGNLSGSPSISFGLTGSNFKGNVISIPTADGYDYYQGEFNAQGQFHGYGKYIYSKNKHEYHGQFENGKPHGKGVLYKNVGNFSNNLQQKTISSNLFIVYEGQWRNGMKNGQGKYYYNSENHYYQGPWLNDQRHGSVGTYVSPIGKYVGKWQKGRMQGRGEFNVFKTNTKYLGNFHNNQFVNGVITYPNKDEYSGGVRNGLREDNQGRYHYNRLGEEADQVRYIGGWKGDLKNDKTGQATLTYLNGQTLKGTYEDNKFVYTAPCEYLWTDGDLFNGWLQRGPSGTNLKGVIKKSNGKQYEV